MSSFSQIGNQRRTLSARLASHQARAETVAAAHRARGDCPKYALQ
jgi:hypothetical protein